MKKRWFVWMVFGVFVVFLHFASLRAQEEESIYKQVPLFTDAITIIQSEYVEEVKAKDLIYGALRGMLVSLDKHSQFLDPDEYKEMQVETKGEFGGLGIVITIKDNLLTIISPLEDTPAYRAGVKSGDRIVKIDGESTKDITLMQAVKKMRGKPGTDCTITIMREDEKKLLEFTITRDIIKIKSVKEAKVIEDKIGYIRIVEFQLRTPQDLEKALNRLEKEGIDSLILDLRNNPGGLLETSVEVADKFIASGVIVSTRGRIKSQEQEFVAHLRGTHPDYPMVIMINEGSASASEIVAGAVQDNNRGILLGTKTFGKGSVQTVVPMADGSALRLTTAKYFTPSGRCIHEVGITPDIVVEVSAKPSEEAEVPMVEEAEVPMVEEAEVEVYDEQLERAIDLLKGIKVLGTFE